LLTTLGDVEEKVSCSLVM